MEKFPYGRTFILGFGFFGISIIWPLFNSLIPPMLEDLGLSALVVGFILTWDNIINMFVQPWVGSRSDRTRSRFGRRKPYLMLGAPAAALFFILVPFVRDNFVLIGLAILGTNLGMALFRSPTVAYLGDLFKPGDRSKANGVINLMGGLGGAVALFGGGALYKLGVPLPFIAGSGVMLLAIMVVLIAVREPTMAEEAAAADAPGLIASARRVLSGSDRNPILLLTAIFCWFVGWNAMEAFFTIYARSVLGIDIGSGTQMLTAFAATLILFAIPSGLIATRFGRRPTIIIGLSGNVRRPGRRVLHPRLHHHAGDARVNGFILGVDQHQLVADGLRPWRRRQYWCVYRVVLLRRLGGRDHRTDPGGLADRSHQSSFDLDLQCRLHAPGRTGHAADTCSTPA